ncbi:MAG: tetratricopeptide repeat protein [Anaerolineae bacterium]|nr:tetratricopeptide repeat protein [Anaerolineae bacterium]
MADHLLSDAKNPAPLRQDTAPLSAHQVRRIMRRQLEQLPDRAFLSSSDIALLCRRLASQRYAPGEAILMEGTHGDCLGLVTGGQVAGYSSLAGRDSPDMLLLPGSVFGEAMLLDGVPSSHTYRAITDTEIRFLRRVDFLGAIDQRRYRLAALINRWLRRLATLVPVLIAIAILLATPFTRQIAVLVPYAAGLWLAQHGRMAGAERALSITVRLAPDWPMPHLSLGNVCLYLGDLAQAESEFRQIISIAPDVAEAYNSLGLLYTIRGNHAMAIPLFERALTAEPGQATVESNLAFSLQLDDQPGKALPHYALARILGIPRPILWVNEAIAHYEVGDRDAAQEIAAQALDLADAAAPAYTVLGAAALPEQPEKAADLFMDAIRADPGYVPAHFYLGLAAKLLGQPELAINAFERVLDLNPTDPLAKREARLHLSELYAQDGTSISYRQTRADEERR